MKEIAASRARLLYTGAVGFLVAAEATHERHLREPNEPEYWPAIGVNVCFALELSAKAYLASRGASESQLRSTGHNLTKALSEAESAGFKVSHPAISDLVSILGPLHQGHVLRYLEDREVELPDARNMIAIARRYVIDVGAQIPVADL